MFRTSTDALGLSEGGRFVPTSDTFEPDHAEGAGLVELFSTSCHRVKEWKVWILD